MEKHGDDNKVRLLKRKGRVKNSHWALKATIITFFTSAFFSFVAESTESNGNLIVIVVLLLFLIVGNVVFDGIGIAAATADETEGAAKKSRYTLSKTRISCRTSATT